MTLNMPSRNVWELQVSNINFDISNKTSLRYVCNTQNSELHMYVKNSEIDNSMLIDLMSFHE